jgi:hypothetical protein
VQGPLTVLSEGEIFHSSLDSITQRSFSS